MCIILLVHFFGSASGQTSFSTDHGTFTFGLPGGLAPSLQHASPVLAPALLASVHHVHQAGRSQQQVVKAARVDPAACQLHYEEFGAEVCFPTLVTDCELEEGGQSVELYTEQHCTEVVRTVCVERQRVEDFETCAFSFTLKPVTTEARIVEPVWQEICHQERVCVKAAPRANFISFGAFSHSPHDSDSDECRGHEEIHETCTLEPTLSPVIRPVTVSLAKPVEVCIKKQVVLPYVECEKVSERLCMVVPIARKGLDYQINKCSLQVGEEACRDTLLQLPTQVCPERVNVTQVVETL